jgi:hypothetical protein
VYSLLFWSSLTPWGRRLVVARRRLVDPDAPVEVVEEPPPPPPPPPPPFDDGRL